MLDEPLLAVKDLTSEITRSGGSLRAVDGVSLTVRSGEAVALVGESGSGKTVTALSILGLMPDPPCRVTGGEVRFKGQDLLRLDEERLRQIRGDQIGMVFQEPAAALNPVLSIGEQVAETVRAHREGVSRAEARRRAVELLARMGIPDAARRYRAYPHQLSGGMLQRVVLATALICEPDLLIADEPTSALDVTTQAQIMALLSELQQGERRLALLLISHDLALVAQACSRVVVLYAGQVVEQATVDHLFEGPGHPYTAALLRAIRSLDGAADGAERSAAALPRAEAPDRAGPGCCFAPRCTQVQPACRASQTGAAADRSGASCSLHRSAVAGR